MLARELPRFGLKRLMRAGLDLVPYNFLFDTAIATAPTSIFIAATSRE
jgi:hypothetical protein